MAIRPDLDRRAAPLGVWVWFGWCWGADGVGEVKAVWGMGGESLDKSNKAILTPARPAQLKRAVRRNLERFPSDFMFELTREELENLRCQIGISSWVV